MMDKIFATHRKCSVYVLCKYSKPLSLMRVLGILPRAQVLPRHEQCSLSNTILLCRLCSRFTTRLQTIVIVFHSLATSVSRSKNRNWECEHLNTKRIIRVNIIEIIIPSKFHLQLRNVKYLNLWNLVNWVESFWTSPEAALNPSAKSIRAMRFMSKVSTVKKKNLGQENPFCYPLPIPPYPTAGRFSWVNNGARLTCARNQVFSHTSAVH